MYEIIENPKIMEAAEIDKVFKGKWVYLVQVDQTAHGKLIKAMPVVVGDAPFEGVEEGIYDEYDKEGYGTTLSYTLLENHCFMAIMNLG